MVAAAFVYLSILAYLLYRRNNCVDVACFIILIYAASAFLGILMDSMGLRYDDSRNYKVSFVAVFVYCALITLCVLPIAHYSNARIKGIRPIKNPKFLTVMAIVSFSYFILFCILSYADVRQSLSEDFVTIRNSLYSGDEVETWMSRLPDAIRPIFSLFNMFFGNPWILMFLGFFSIVVQRLPNKYGYMLIAASLMGPISGIVGVDRSQSAYWILSLAACYIYFAPFMTKEQKHLFRTIFYVLSGLFVAYLAFATISRFGETDEGTEGGLVSYLGQPIIHFCFFFDVFENKETFLSVIFPFSSQYFFGGEFNTPVQAQAHITATTGIFAGVFYTFLGNIMIMGGGWLMVVYVLFLLWLTVSSQKRQDLSTTTLKRSYLFFFCSSIMFLGLFAHYYAGAMRTFSLLANYLLIKNLVLNEDSLSKSNGRLEEG